MLGERPEMLEEGAVLAVGVLWLPSTDRDTGAPSDPRGLSPFFDLYEAEEPPRRGDRKPRFPSGRGKPAMGRREMTREERVADPGAHLG